VDRRNAASLRRTEKRTQHERLNPLKKSDLIGKIKDRRGKSRNREGGVPSDGEGNNYTDKKKKGRGRPSLGTGRVLRGKHLSTGEERDATTGVKSPHREPDKRDKEDSMRVQNGKHPKNRTMYKTGPELS